jgi:hypothetical protein
MVRPWFAPFFLFWTDPCLTRDGFSREIWLAGVRWENNHLLNSVYLHSFEIEDVLDDKPVVAYIG